MVKEKGNLTLAIIIVVCFTAVIAIGLYFIYDKSFLIKLFTKKQKKTVVCTQEVKVCPDGSAVGRTGPNCEFTKCPEPIILSNCYTGGCNGQICSDKEGVVSTCEYKKEYACYKNAKCERQSNGQCEWTITSELTACLDINK